MLRVALWPWAVEADFPRRGLMRLDAPERDDLARLHHLTTACGARFGDLTMAAIQYVEGHIQEGLPLALPPVVAQVYLDDPGVVAIHDCENCGYEVPMGYGEPHASPAKPLRIYFDRCPLCGGKTGYYAFYQGNARLKKTSGPAAKVVYVNGE